MGNPLTWNLATNEQASFDYKSRAQYFGTSDFYGLGSKSLQAATQTKKIVSLRKTAPKEVEKHGVRTPYSCAQIL